MSMRLDFCRRQESLLNPLAIMDQTAPASSGGSGASGCFREVHQEFPGPAHKPLIAIASVSFDLHPGKLVTLAWGST